MEQPETFTTKELVAVCTQLIQAKAHYLELATWYFSLFNKKKVDDGSTLKLNSPFCQFCQKMAEYYATQAAGIDFRIAALDAIANDTVTPGLEKIEFSGKPLSRKKGA